MSVHAPYNFIPFPTKVIRRYRSMEELPSFNRIYPELKTGEIKVTLTAKTPVYIGDNQKRDFYKNVNGQYEIKGSTIRGLLRENIQILGLGLIRPEREIDNYQIFFRKLADSSQGVAAKVKEYYRNVMDVNEVKAGYLTKGENGYYILPVQKGYWKLSRKHEDIALFKNGSGVPCATVTEVAYTVKNNKIDHIVPVKEKTSGMETGVMLSTGKSVKNTNPLYIFSQADHGAEKVEIKEGDLLDYCVDYENRINSLKAYYPVEFWELPQKIGQSKPVFYLKHDGHVYFGMSLYLRIGYPHKIAEGIPASIRKLLEEPLFLDYPYAMLGFAENTIAYRSRIRVGSFAVSDRKMLDKVKDVEVMLSSPKPSYYPGYLKNGKSYVDDEFQLRGYKQYWMKNPEERTEQLKKKDMPSATKMHPLPAGTEFTGVIRYQNLQEDELGLLLWALMLDKDCYQEIGMGKPYGYGRIQVTVNGIREYCMKDLYNLSDESASLPDWDDQHLLDYIQKYKVYASGLINDGKKEKSIDQLQTIQSFMFLHRMIDPDSRQIDTSYMQLDDYRKQREVLPEIRELMQEKKEEKPDKIIMGGLDVTALSGKMNLSKSNKKRETNSRGKSR